MIAPALIALLLAAPETTAACAPGQQCIAGLSAADLFAAADRLAAGGSWQKAIAVYRALEADPDADVRAEARFRRGELLEKAGDLAGAAAAYRALLEEKPNAGRPRLDLARVLAALGDEAAARRELRRAGAAGLPDDVARAVDSFDVALRSRRPYGAAFEVALAPDSNINRATGRGSIDTVIGPLEPNRDARARSGIGASVAGQGYWRAGEGSTTLLARLSGRANLYGRARFNDVTAALALGPEVRDGPSRWRPALTASRRWYGGRRYSDGRGLSLNWLRPLDPQSQIEVDVSAVRLRYPLIRGQDGAAYAGSVAYDRAFSARFSGRLGGRLARVTARDPGYADIEAGIDLVAARAIGRQTIFTQLSATRLEADDRLALFARRRRETRVDLTVGLLLRRWQFAGVAPLVRLVRSVSDSTVDIYGFRRTRLEFGLSREF